MSISHVPEPWIPTVPPGETALYLRLARAVAVDIRAGRLRAGERLPGARPMAERLGVHRHTVAAAWRELASEGWVVTTPRGGARVARVRPLPDVAPAAGEAAFPVHAPSLGRPPELDAPGRLVLHGGRPDLRLLPLAALGRAWRRAVARHGRALVDYGDGRGHPVLREALAHWLRERRGLTTVPANLLVTRGAQQALHLAARVCLRPGQRIAVEEHGYAPAWATFALAGLECVPVPVDGEGMRVDRLDGLGVSGVYVTPHHQYPTMVSLAPARRAALLGWAAAARVPVLEDDYDHEFHFRGRPRLPLAHADRAGVVVYVGTLSKALAPGLRLGFVSAAPAVVDAMLAVRVALDRQGDAVTERAVAELLLDGELDRHLARMRGVYERRGRLLAALVREELGVPQGEPEGGLSLWVPYPRPAALRRGCEARGVSFRIGADSAFAAAFPATGGEAVDPPFLRLGFANLDEAELTRAMRIVGEVSRSLGG